MYSFNYSLSFRLVSSPVVDHFHCHFSFFLCFCFSLSLSLTLHPHFLILHEWCQSVCNPSTTRNLTKNKNKKRHLCAEYSSLDIPIQLVPLTRPSHSRSHSAHSLPSSFVCPSSSSIFHQLTPFYLFLPAALLDLCRQLTLFTHSVTHSLLHFFLLFPRLVGLSLDNSV